MGGAEAWGMHCWLEKKTNTAHALSPALPIRATPSDAAGERYCNMLDKLVQYC